MDQPVAQLVEPAAHNGLVAGSNPAGLTKNPWKRLTNEKNPADD